MSAWSSFKGTLSVPRNAHFSVAHAITSFQYDEVQVSVKTRTLNQYYVHEIDVMYSLENEAANDLFKKFLATIPKNSKYDFVTNMR